MTVYNENDLTYHIINNTFIKVLFPSEKKSEKEIEFDYSNLRDCFKGDISSCYFCLRYTFENKRKEKQGEIFLCETDVEIEGKPTEYVMTTFNIIQKPDTFSEEEILLAEDAISFLLVKDKEGQLFDDTI